MGSSLMGLTSLRPDRPSRDVKDGETTGMLQTMRQFSSGKASDI